MPGLHFPERKGRWLRAKGLRSAPGLKHSPGRKEGDGFRVTADIWFLENLGSTLLLHAPDFPSGTLVIESRASEPPEPGSMEVSIDPARINLFDEAWRGPHDS